MATTGAHEEAPALWGDYQWHVEDLVAVCTDDLRRIRNGVSDGCGGRPYVADKAQALRGSAHRLARFCHQAQRLLASCRAEFSCLDGAFPQECMLPAGHGGPHRIVRADPPVLRLMGIAEEAADASLAFWDTLARMSWDPAHVLDCADLADLDLALRRADHRLSAARHTLDALKRQASAGGCR